MSVLSGIIMALVSAGVAYAAGRHVGKVAGYGEGYDDGIEAMQQQIGRERAARREVASAGVDDLAARAGRFVRPDA